MGALISSASEDELGSGRDELDVAISDELKADSSR